MMIHDIETDLRDHILTVHSVDHEFNPICLMDEEIQDTLISVQEDNVCDDCGFKSKSLRGLKTHKLKITVSRTLNFLTYIF